MRSFIFLSFTAVVILFLGSTAYAQSFSGRGVLSGSQANVTCLGEVERLRFLVETLIERRDAMIACNNKDQVYAGEDAPGDGCVDLALNEASWDNLNNPTALQFVTPEVGNIGDEITVLRGKPGPRGECPDDLREVTTR